MARERFKNKKPKGFRPGSGKGGSKTLAQRAVTAHLEGMYQHDKGAGSCVRFHSGKCSLGSAKCKFQNFRQGQDLKKDPAGCEKK